MADKLTDDDIKKALECCMYGHGCEGCPYIGKGFCSDKLKRDALDLINRQQAELERLEKHSKEVAENCTFVMRENDKATNKRFLEAIEVVKAEAIKEFARRARGMITIRGRQKDYFDNLVKEMAGADE